MPANFQIPEGTPLLCRDGETILVRFKFLQGERHGDQRELTWAERPFFSPAAYNNSSEPADKAVRYLSARRILHCPALQVWQADFDMPETMEDWAACFPEAMFQPADTMIADLELSKAITTALADHEVTRILERIGGAAHYNMADGMLREYAEYLRHRGMHSIGLR